MDANEIMRSENQILEDFKQIQQLQPQNVNFPPALLSDAALELIPKSDRFSQAKELDPEQILQMAIRICESRFKCIADSNMLGIAFWHGDGLIEDANDAFLQVIGYTKAGLKTQSISWKDLTPPEYQELDLKALEEMAKEGVCTPYEKECIRPDGSRIPILVGGALLTGCEDRGVCFILDITQRKLEEEALKQAKQQLETRLEERTAQLLHNNNQWLAEVVERKRAEASLEKSLSLLRATLEAIGEGAIVTHHAKTIALYNQKFVDMWGIAESTIAARDLEQVLPSILAQLQAPDLFLCKLHHLFAQPEAIGYSIIELKDGRTFEHYSQPQRFGDTIIGRVCTFRDISLRKQAEVALQESEARFRRFCEATFEGIMIHENAQILDTNQAFAQMFGYETAELIGMDALQLLAVELRELAAQKMREGYEKPYELVGIKKDGSMFAIEVQGKAFWYQGKTVRVAAIRDITVRKAAEVALRESDARLRMVVANAPIVLYATDRNGTIAFSDGRELESWGCQPNAVVGQSLFDLYSDRPDIADRFRRVLAGSEVDWIEEGQGKVYEHRVAPLWDQSGAVTGAIGITLDISDRQRAEKALERANTELESRVQERTAQLQTSEQKYRSVVDNLKEVIFQTDTAGLWSFLNPAWVEITGFSIEESLNTCFLKYIDPEDSQENWEQFQLLMKQQKDYCRHEVRYLTKTGCCRWMEVFARLTLDGEGRAIGTSGTLNDITERKQAEAEIRKALETEKELSNLKTRFVTMASHEFRTPLATILVASDLLKNFGHKLSEEKKQEQLNKIQGEVQHMTQLLEDVLFMGKVAAERLEFKPAPLNLKAFCQEILSGITLTNPSSNRFNFQCLGDCPLVEMDEKLLRQILSNLLGNAVKYSSPGKPIELKLVCESELVIFQVKDWGIGIPKAEQSRIFDAFHRCSNVGNISGTGLGMAIAKQAVELHGGRISVESEEGVGTTFTVCLPTFQVRPLSF